MKELEFFFPVREIEIDEDRAHDVSREEWGIGVTRNFFRRDLRARRSLRRCIRTAALSTWLSTHSTPSTARLRRLLQLLARGVALRAFKSTVVVLVEVLQDLARGSVRSAHSAHSARSAKAAGPTWSRRWRSTKEVTLPWRCLPNSLCRYKKCEQCESMRTEG